MQQHFLERKIQILICNSMDNASGNSNFKPWNGEVKPGQCGERGSVSANLKPLGPLKGALFNFESKDQRGRNGNYHEYSHHPARHRRRRFKEYPRGAAYQACKSYHVVYRQQHGSGGKPPSCSLKQSVPASSVRKKKPSVEGIPKVRSVGGIKFQ